MAIEINVPRLGWSMEEGTFIEWLKREGEAVQAGEPLFAIEGDKAIQEVEAIGSGILRISPAAPENGEVVKVGVTLAFLVGPEEGDPFQTALSKTAGAIPRKPEQTAKAWTSERQNGDSADDDCSSPPAFEHVSKDAERSYAKRPRISPRAARIAAELGIDWKRLVGSGRTGRIRERDVRAAAATKPKTLKSAPDVGTAPQPTFRRTIAARMAEGAHATAPVTLTTTADATNLVSLRAQFKAAVKSTDELVPNYTDLVAKLAARALMEHPALNQQWIDGRIVAPEGIHIAIAVDTPAGLLAPVLRDVLTLGLRDIAARTRDLKTRALAGRLESPELGGGTFTISNLGAFGIDAFTPIINVPQCAILGLGRIERRPAVVGEQIVPREMITLSLTFDHRIVDGAPAARFLAALRGGIENPGPWLVF